LGVFLALEMLINDDSPQSDYLQLTHQNHGVQQQKEKAMLLLDAFAWL
jgi:hypothetical protein